MSLITSLLHRQFPCRRVLIPSRSVHPLHPLPSHQSSSPRPSSRPSVARPSTARHLRSSASTASALQRVISKTRPAHLPPKPRDDDLKHQCDWDGMMRRSREAKKRVAKSRTFMLKNGRWKLLKDLQFGNAKSCLTGGRCSNQDLSDTEECGGVEYLPN